MLGGLRVNIAQGFPWDTPNSKGTFGEILNCYQARRLWLSSSPLWTLILFSVSLLVAGVIMGFGPMQGPVLIVPGPPKPSAALV